MPRDIAKILQEYVEEYVEDEDNDVFVERLESERK